MAVLYEVVDYDHREQRVAERLGHLEGYTLTCFDTIAHEYNVCEI